MTAESAVFGVFVTQHLDGDVAVQRQVLGKIDDGHSATADLTLDLIATG